MFSFLKSHKRLHGIIILVDQMCLVMFELLTSSSLFIMKNVVSSHITLR